MLSKTHKHKHKQKQKHNRGRAERRGYDRGRAHNRAGNSIRLALVVACGQNGVIGRQGAMPWHMKTDLAHFRQLTTSHMVVMGRKTFESIGRALPNRLNIVLTHNKHFKADDVIVCHTKEDVLASAQLADKQTLFVIGGAEIYALFAPLAQTVYLTKIYASPEGDTFFPPLDEKEWHKTEILHHKKQAGDDYDCDFITLERIIN